MKNKCKICSKKIVGRIDKLFCSIKCKNYYHINLRKVTNNSMVVLEIDKILHRNRGILLELLGKRKKQLTVERIQLQQKKFQFKYYTHQNVNSKGKTYYYVYDFAWMEFSNDAILIVRK